MRSAMPEVESLISLGSHSVSGLWKYMMPEEVFYFRVDAESRSTCFACPKVKEAGFHEDVRCCTVIPRVPNFMIGLGLKAGHEKISKQFAAGRFLPEGLIISPEELNRSLSFISAPEPGLPSVVCPFLDLASKRCGIYEYRSTTCSSFFCKTDRGTASMQFWSDFADFGSQVESALSQWALVEAGFDLKEYFTRLDSLQPHADSGWTDEQRRLLFGPWYERERELFLATADAILEHKENLFSIASNFKPMQAKEFDRKLRVQFQPSFAEELIDEALPEGEAESIESLWYQLKLSARNLQLAPKTW